MEKSKKLKILKWAIVAWILLFIPLGILVGAFSKVYALCAMSCVPNPVGELVSTTQEAEAGTITNSEYVCMRSLESFTATNLESKISDINSITLRCGDGVPICYGNDASLIVEPNQLSANADVKFKASVECISDSGSYDCVITIIEASKGIAPSCSSPSYTGTPILIIWVIGLFVLLVVISYVKRS